MHRSLPCSDESIDVVEITFNIGQANSLDIFTRHLASLGGPSVDGVQKQAVQYAALFTAQLSEAQNSHLKSYSAGHLAALIFTGMIAVEPRDIPEELPPMAALEDDARCLYLASRNQFLLCLVQQTPFAFDMDNEGKMVRLVGNFKGGGAIPRADEGPAESIELSSHAGLQLGAHTEAPYHCCLMPRDGHSPAPSSLVLSALWNPLDEPTRVIPMGQILDNMGARMALALTSKSFGYTRSDSFVAGKGEQDKSVSILEFDEQGEFAVRYNDYRFSLMPNAGPWVKRAFTEFRRRIKATSPLEVVLQPSSAIIINNSRALHGRDVLKDNRRLLVRLFGYSKFVQPVVLNEDPLIVRG